jgi:predicted ribonuclease YlaK
VVVVTKDLPLRLKASIVGLPPRSTATSSWPTTRSWTGFVELDTSREVIDELYDERVADLAEARQLPCHTGVALHAGSQSALAGSTPTSGSTSCAPTASCSACAGGRPSSGSRWTSSPMTRWAS